MQNADLEQAYALDGADSCKALYAEWADSYDTGFAQSMGYRLPDLVAGVFLRANPQDGAVLDVGAGTGLLAQSLRRAGWSGALDAADLSMAMLEKARHKGLYRSLYEADITKPLAISRRYAGIVSSGTFTHGHVGPEALPHLLDIAAPGAVIAFSVNAAIWESLRFDAALDALRPRLGSIERIEDAIYGDGALQHDPEHAKDRAILVTLRLT